MSTIVGIVDILQSGYRWKDAPAAYVSHKTLYNSHKRWSEKAYGARCSKHSPPKAGRLRKC